MALNIGKVNNFYNGPTTVNNKGGPTSMGDGQRSEVTPTNRSDLPVDRPASLVTPAADQPASQATSDADPPTPGADPPSLPQIDSSLSLGPPSSLNVPNLEPESGDRRQEPLLRTPIAVSSESEGQEHNGRWASQPVALHNAGPITTAQPSSDYLSVGRQSLTIDSASLDPTAMQELKAEGGSDWTSVRDNGTEPPWQTEQTDRKLGFEDSSLETDGPITPVESPTTFPGLPRSGVPPQGGSAVPDSPRGVSPGPHSCPPSGNQEGQNLNPPVFGNSNFSSNARDGYGRQNFSRMVFGNNEHSANTRDGDRGHNFSPLESGNSEVPANTGKGEREGTAEIPPSRTAEVPSSESLSLPSSLHEDGGGGSVGEGAAATGVTVNTPVTSGNGQTTQSYALFHKGVLLHDEEHDVFMMESKPKEVTLRKAMEAGQFADGHSALLQLKWRGFCPFDLSRWKLAVRSDAAGTPPMGDIIRHLQEIFSDDWEAACLRTTSQLLHHRHSVFLCGVAWNGGLLFDVGHESEEKRSAFLSEGGAGIERVQTLLLQLLPERAGDRFSWEEPTPHHEEEEEDPTPHGEVEEEEEDLGQSIPIEEVEASVSLSVSSQYSTSVSEGLGSSLHVSPTESQLPDRLSAACGNRVDPLNRTLGSILQQITHVGNSQESVRELRQAQVSQDQNHRNQMDELTQRLGQLQDQKEELQKLHTSAQQQIEALREEQGEMKEQISKLLQHQTETNADTKRRLECAEKSAEKQRAKDMQTVLERNRSQIAEMNKRFELEKKVFQDEQLHEQQKARQKQEEDVQALQEVMQRDTQRRMDDLQHQWRKTMDEEVSKRVQQVMLTELQKLRQEMDSRFKGQAQAEGALPLTVGRVQAEEGKEVEEGEEEGAVGGTAVRNKFSSALATSEEYTSKMKGKEEGVTANHLSLEETLRLPSMPQQSRGDGRHVQDQAAKSRQRTGASRSPTPEKKHDPDSRQRTGASRSPTPEKKHDPDSRQRTGASRSPTPEKKHDPDSRQRTGASRSPTPENKHDPDSRQRTGASRSPTPERKHDPDSRQRTGASRSPTPEKKHDPDSRQQTGASRSSTPERKRDPSADSQPGRSTTEVPEEGSQESAEDFIHHFVKCGPMCAVVRAEEFLSWITVHGHLNDSKMAADTITRHVSAALKEEVTPAPRAKCLDTILCLDISDSIVQGGHLDTVKNTAMDFVNGIEDLMDEGDLEENVAVVGVGGHARVVQHLTNDLTLVRDAIDSLDDQGGRSPLMQALLVCLAANKGRGGIVTIAGVLQVHPRIIFITDGVPTDESQVTGPDTQGNKQQITFSMVQLLSQLSSKKHKSTPRPITWVPVGDRPDKVFLKSMAEVCGGKMVEPDKVRSLCRYYKIQQITGRLYKMVKSKEQNIIKEEKILELLTAIAYDTITEGEKEEIVRKVRELQNSPPEQEEPEADDYDNVYEDEVKVKSGELLALGTRVVRGPDWKWKNQDTDGPGTVLHHGKKDNWIYVMWDNGTNNAYRYCQDGKSDIQETQHHPRVIPLDSEKLDIGVRVVRGPQWKWENQDGKGVGTVIRLHESDAKVKVRWDLTSSIYSYHFSPEKRQVQIHMLEFRRNTDSREHLAAHLLKAAQGDSDKTIPMWKWRDEIRQWRLYDETLSDKLEMEYRKRPSASCVVMRDRKHRRVSFKLLQEKTVDTGSTVDVMREMVDEDRKNDLLAIELSLQFI